jgi:hypothetical protein
MLQISVLHSYPEPEIMQKKKPDASHNSARKLITIPLVGRTTTTRRSVKSRAKHRTAEHNSRPYRQLLWWNFLKNKTKKTKQMEATVDGEFLLTPFQPKHLR